MARPKRAVSSSTSEERSETELATSSYVQQLEKRIEEKDDTVQFQQDELKDRRTQIRDMKGACLWRTREVGGPKGKGDDSIVATMVDDADGSASTEPRVAS
jgi:hypothetical protein